jgi:DNA polymerase-3 subunit delta'
LKFNNVIGNLEVKDYLRKSIEEGNILHSYLFLGTEGIGKLIIAKEFAKYILCLENSSENCMCKSCLCYDGNNHPDFKIVNEAGETIKIEQIRALIEKVIEKPIVSNRKVYIINDCDKMTKEAQNCLLKTLEEPPEFATIILISSNENMILNTIKSRCMKVKFKNIDNKSLYDYAINQIGYEDVSENLLKTFDGSIGKAIMLQENKEKYAEIDTLMDRMKTDDIISIFLTSKFIYDKEKIFEILDYLTVCLYSKSKEDKRYLNCLKYVSESTLRLKSNGNFDMNVDSLLFNIWEELNEKSNRR